MEPVRIIHQNYGGICSWYCSRTYFWRESNKAGISWNYIDPSADYGSCTIGAGTLICSAADVKDFKTLGKIGGKTLGIFLGGTAIAVAIGLVLCNIMQIGAGFVMESAQAYDAKEIPSIVDTLMDIIPTNPFNSLSTQNLLQIIFSHYC